MRGFGNKGNIRLRLTCTQVRPTSNYAVFSHPLEKRDFVTPPKGFIGRISPELDELKSNF